MNERYIRSLGPIGLQYVEKQSQEFPEHWRQHLDMARQFNQLTEQVEWPAGDARRLLEQAEACGDRGTVWLEMLIALRVIANG